MVLDSLKNYELYLSMNDGFKKGFEFIEKCKKEGMATGKYEIDGKKVYANVQEYNSKEVAKFESHKNYIDIQYVLDGEEKMLYEDVTKCNVNVPYNDVKDVMFYEDIDSAKEFVVKKDEFAIFFPGDCHKPGMKVNESAPVKKIIIKVQL